MFLISSLSNVPAPAKKLFIAGPGTPELEGIPILLLQIAQLIFFKLRKLVLTQNEADGLRRR